jgi:hypothetical protein
VISTLAVRLLYFHVTSCATERNWSFWGNIYVNGRNRLGLERAGMIVYIRLPNSDTCCNDDEEIMLSQQSLLEEE